MAISKEPGEGKPAVNPAKSVKTTPIAVKVTRNKAVQRPKDNFYIERKKK